MNIKQSFAILAIIGSLGFQLKGQQYFFRQYTGMHGLHHAFVYSIAQDINGSLWLGTPDGLYTFDGFEFNHITKENGIASDFVTEIFKDSGGRMWVGHQNGSLSVFTKKGFMLLNQEPEYHGSVTDIIQDDLGTIWVAIQNQGLLSVNEDFNIRQIPFPIDQEPVTELISAGSNRFIVGTQESLYLTGFDSIEGSMSIINKIDQYPGSKVVEIIATTAGHFLIASQEEGFHGLRIDTPVEDYSYDIYDDNKDGSLDNLQGGLLDGKGSVWLNSLGQGLMRFQKDSLQNYYRSDVITSDDGLISGSIKSLFEDNEGNIWLGMYGEGLLRYVDNNLNFYSFGFENEWSGIHAIAGILNSILFSDGNQLFEYGPEKDTLATICDLPVPLLQDRLNTIFLAEDGRLWLGYEQSGLFVSSKPGSLFSSIPISKDKLSNSINHITGNGGSIWVGTKKGLCKIEEETDTFKWFNTDHGLPHNNIKHLYIDSENRVLVATLCSEIYYIDDDNHCSVYEGSYMAPFTSVVSISQSTNGDLWVATQGNGVWKLGEVENQNYSKNSGLLNDYCYSLILTDGGDPVVGHRGGISVIDPEENRITTFSQKDGVKSSTDFFFNAAYRDHQKNIWMGTTEGLMKYTPGSPTAGKIPPDLHVTTVLLDGDTVNHAEGQIILKPGRYELQVSYIGIWFTNPEMVYYQTQLEGYNRDWSEPTYSRKMVIDRLEHGDYNLKIRAYNENGIHTEISSALTLKIKKPIYLSIWLYVLLAVSIGVAFYMTLRIRERNHRMIQDRLLRNLDEKTKEIIVKEEIIKERKKVEKILIEAKEKAEVSETLKTSFLHNMSHEIRTPMNAIVGFSQLLKEEGVTEEMRNEFVDNVSTNAESLLGLIDDILDVSKLETNQLRITKGLCNLNELIVGLEVTYKKRLRTLENDEIELIAEHPPGDSIEISTDGPRLVQVLSKLLDNAVKFTETGQIRFGFNPGNGMIEFFVEDTGIGLSQEKKEVIFDLFRKIEEDKVKLYGGTGLGLTLSRYLVNLMGGEIDVVSDEGVGSRFFFTLPAEENHENSRID